MAISEANGLAESAYVIEPLLPWQSAPLEDWLGQRARWHHATLLHGPAGSGIRRLGFHLAQGLLCRTLAEGGATGTGLACGQCDACHLFITGGHPDFRLVARTHAEKPDAAGELRLRDAIVVDQVRELIDDFLYLTSHRQGAKVVMIYLAEEMNPAAANGLLKSLEEPPPDTFFLLLSHRLRRLRPTVISRCRMLPAPQPATEIAADWLTAQGAADAPLLLAQAGGAPLKALTMMDEDYQAERARFLRRLAEPRRLSVIAMGLEVDTGPRVVRKARLQAWFDWLATWTFDLALCASGGTPRYHPDFAQQLANLSAVVAPQTVLRYHRALLVDRALLAHPLNARLVAENALFGYRQAVLGE